MNYLTSYFQNYIKDKDIRSFKYDKKYYFLFRLLRKFFDDNFIINIYNFKISASFKKNYTSHALLRKCDFDDKTELNILKDLSKNNNIYLMDCGSNYGFYSLFVAGLDLNNQVISIEASKKTSQILKKNIELNSFENIRILNNALSDQDGEEVIFNESINDWESSVAHNNFQLSNQTKILTKKIDTILDLIELKKNQILVIKLDIEGNEFKAISGGISAIQKFEPIIIIELSRYIFNSESSYDFLRNFLNEFDYEIYDNKKKNVEIDKIFKLINELDKNHDTIGNYYLIKNNSKNLNLFLLDYD